MLFFHFFFSHFLRETYHVLQIRVAVDPEAAETRKGDSADPVRLEITFTETYPDDAPKIAVKYSHIVSDRVQSP